MAFVRSKCINGNWYDYLVENHRVNGKVRQRVVRYLGRSDGDSRDRHVPWTGESLSRAQIEARIEHTKDPKLKARYRALLE